MACLRGVPPGPCQGTTGVPSSPPPPPSVLVLSLVGPGFPWKPGREGVLSRLGHQPLRVRVSVVFGDIRVHGGFWFAVRAPAGHKGFLWGPPDPALCISLLTIRPPPHPRGQVLGLRESGRIPSARLRKLLRSPETGWTEWTAAEQPAWAPLAAHTPGSGCRRSTGPCGWAFLWPLVHRPQADECVRESWAAGRGQRIRRCFLPLLFQAVPPHRQRTASEVFALHVKFLLKWFMAKHSIRPDVSTKELGEFGGSFSLETADRLGRGLRQAAPTSPPPRAPGPLAPSHRQQQPARKVSDAPSAGRTRKPLHKTLVFPFTDPHALCSRERVSLELHWGEVIAAASSAASPLFITGLGLSHRSRMPACFSLSVVCHRRYSVWAMDAGGLMFSMASGNAHCLPQRGEPLGGPLRRLVGVGDAGRAAPSKAVSPSLGMGVRVKGRWDAGERGPFPRGRSYPLWCPFSLQGKPHPREGHRRGPSCLEPGAAGNYSQAAWLALVPVSVSSSPPPGSGLPKPPSLELRTPHPG